MCGFVGFIQKQKDFKTLENMLKIQSYRGPDDSGMYFDVQKKLTKIIKFSMIFRALT